VVNLVGSAAIQSKTINTTSADLTFVPGTTFNPVSSGDKAWFRVGSNDWRALFAADGVTTQITATGPYNSTTRVIPLNGNPAFYWTSGGLVALNIVSGSTIIGFKSTASTTSTNDASMKSGTVSSSETVGTTNLTPTLSSIRGTIAIGMTVTGTNVPTNTSVTNVTFDVNGNILSVELNKDLSAVSNGTTLTFVGGSSQITGRHGTLLLNSDGNYVYTPFAQNPNLNSGQSWVERFFYVISDLDGALSQTFPDSDPGSRIDAILSSTEPASLNITVFGASLDDPNAVNDTATAVEAGGTLNGTAGSNPSALAPGLLGNDTTPSGSISITSAQSYGSGTPINVSTNTTIPGIYGDLVLSSNGSYTYTVNNSLPEVEALRNSSQTLQEIFLYTISNGSGTDAATFTITIEGANDAPVAVNDFATAVEAGGFKNDIPGVNPSGNLLAMIPM
jgi:VCBS repeat-containing protein